MNQTFFYDLNEKLSTLDKAKEQLTENVAEGLKQTLRKFDPTIKARIRDKSQDQTNQGLDTIQHLADLDLTSDDMVSRAMKPNTYFRNAERYAKLANKGVAEGLGTSPDRLLARTGMNNAHKFPRDGQTDLGNIPGMNTPGASPETNAYADRQRARRPGDLKAAISGQLSKHRKPNLPEQGVAEAVPNSDMAYDRRATTDYALKMREALQDKTTATVNLFYNPDNSITLVVNPMSSQPDATGYLPDGDVGATMKNVDSAIDSYYRMFRQKGWMFQQPREGRITFGVPAQPAATVAEGKTIASGLNDWQKKALKHDTYEKYVSHCNRYDYPHMDKRAWQRYKNAFDNMGTQGVLEDEMDDFIARGGKIQQIPGKPPRKSEKLGGSKHIGGSGDPRGSRLSGLSAKTQPLGKPVVAAEDDSTKPRFVAGKRYGGSAQVDEPEVDDEFNDQPKRKGRPAGSKRAIGAKGPSIRSKLLQKGALAEKENDADVCPHCGAKAVAEKAVSVAQRKAAGIAHAANKGEIPKGKLRGASKEMSKMPAGELTKFAKTKEKGLPEKKKEVDETTVSGSVAPAAEAPKKSSGGMQYGKGIYDSLNRELEAMITESMSINISSSTEGSPSVTVTASDDDAIQLASILKAAGIGSALHADADESCSTCGQSPCGCDEMVDENKPDWPTNTETSNDALQYSGGVNKPKTTVAGDGQTTVPVTAVQVKEGPVDELADMTKLAGVPGPIGQPDEELAESSGEMINGKEVDMYSLWVGGVDYQDSPDFLDAYFEAGSFVDGTPLSDNELKQLTHERGDLVSELASEHMIGAGDPGEEELDESKCMECGMYESKCECNNNMTDSLARLREMAGIQEAAKPNFLDGDKKEPMKKAEKEKDDKKVEESILDISHLWNEYKAR